MAQAVGMGWSRRRWLTGSAALATTGALSLTGGLAACGRKAPVRTTAPAPKPGGATAVDPNHPDALAAAVAGPWRTATDKRRDVWRHPAETLAFFDVKPGATVVELWPGSGWYTQILAPFLAATGGKLYAAQLQTPSADDPASAQVVDDFRTRFTAKPALYGKPEITTFGPTSGPLCPQGTADAVLFLRNFHNWMGAGLAEKVLKDALAALKPGGVLGVEEHRASDGGAQDPLAATGYVQQRYLVQLAQEAGFKLEAASEINANPKDDHDHPFGVWTLPPTRRSSPRGQVPNPKFDQRPYDAIGESDRMTLRFRKPA
ncbi:class I SAM-dependent methyltransferase [soil metagenome]